MSPSKARLKQQWLVWLNGFLQAFYMAVLTAPLAGVLSGAGAITNGEAWAGIIFAVGGRIAQYALSHPIPDIFVTEETITTTTEVTRSESENKV